MYFRFVGYLLCLLIFADTNCIKQKEKPLKCVFVEIGVASWYGPGLQGKRTASGTKFNMDLFTAAHRKLEFGTLIRVTNLNNQKQVVVEIVDRGPVSKKKVLDLSKKAADKIGLIKEGSAEVKIEIVGYKKINAEALMAHYRNIQMINYGKIK
jgi:rare lipoprotein A